MKIKINWSLLLSWLFLASFILILVGWYEFGWKLTKVLPFGLIALILFFQSLTLNRFAKKRWAAVNYTLFALQGLFLLLFLLKIVEINAIWKLSIFVLFIATQIYLVDLNERFENKRKAMNLMMKLFVLVSCISFALLSFSYEFLAIGFSSLIASSLVVIANIFLYKPAK